MIAALLSGILKTSTIFYVSKTSSFLAEDALIYLIQLPQFYQIAHGDSPLGSGYLILPVLLTQTFSSLAAGYLVSGFGRYLYFGYGLWAIANGLFTTVVPTISNARLIGYQILAGVGAGNTLQTGLVSMQAAVRREVMAVVTSMRNILRLLGRTASLAASTAIVNTTAK